jgi:hypothetical protein
MGQLGQLGQARQVLVQGGRRAGGLAQVEVARLQQQGGKRKGAGVSSTTSRMLGCHCSMCGCQGLLAAVLVTAAACVAASKLPRA